MRGYLIPSTVFIATMLLTACDEGTIRDVDTGAITISYNPGRLDKDILHADFSNPGLTSQTLYQKYGEFYCIYLEEILRIGPCALDSSFMVMLDFVTNEYVAEEFHQIEKVHTPLIPGYDEQLETAIKRWVYYFPDSTIPRVVYFNSAFNASIYSTDSIIGIALDFYLGKNHEIVQVLEPEIFPQYVKDNMDPEYLVSDAMKDWTYRQTNRYAPIPGEGNLLDQIIYTGKAMYVLDALLPDVPDSIKMNWTERETDWAKENSGNIWKELAKQEVMFNKNAVDNQKWMTNGPFTNTGSIPQDSPPQLGIWMGWQFVRAYMREYPETTLQQLLDEKNTQKILKAYSPSH